MWECEWEDKKKENPCIKAFLEDNNINYKSILKGKVTKTKIINKVKRGQLFGLVLCDITVPTHLREKFSEFPPIFKNTTISREDIGEHMRQYCININKCKM